MNTKKLNRELNFLLSKNMLPITITHFGKGFDEYKSHKIKNHEKIIGGEVYSKQYKQSYIDCVRIFEIANILGITDNQLLSKWKQVISERKKQISDYRDKPKPEGRDNKGVYVGSGGSNRNKVRYPSKKRSKRVWKIFYEMFPSLAVLDGWDGQKSSKMK